MAEYINKKAFLESQIKRCKHFPPLVGTCTMDNVTLESEIMKFPSADVEPVVHAEWKEITTHNGCTPDYDCVCSNCKESGLPSYKRCPNCGAKMDGGKENEKV